MLSWLVRYKNGKEVKQESGKFNYDNIDRTQLDAFCIFNTKTDFPLITIHFDDSRKKLIYRRRTQLPNSKIPFPIICHIIGWHMNVKGESVKSINFVYEANNNYWIETTGVWDKERNDWFYPVKMREYEL